MSLTCNYTGRVSEQMTPVTRLRGRTAKSNNLTGQVFSTTIETGGGGGGGGNFNFVVNLWAMADGATKTIIHGLSTLNVLVQIYDVASGATIEVTDVLRVDVNTIQVISNQAPFAAGWRVMIIKVA